MGKRLMVLGWLCVVASFVCLFAGKDTFGSIVGIFMGFYIIGAGESLKEKK